MRLINLDSDYIQETLYRRGFKTRQDIEEWLNNTPNIDAVPVVRCKDCKWFADNNGGEWYGCYMFHVVRIAPEDAPKPDDFCSYGERKNGGDSDV